MRRDMGFLVLIVLILLLAAWGILGFVLKVALGVVLGILLSMAILGGLVAWRVRRLLLGPRSRWRRARGRGGSTVEVLDHRDPP
jgi:hypothetical protein